MRRRVELSRSQAASRAYPRARDGLRHPDGGLWRATPGARQEGGRHLEAAGLVVGPRERPDRIVRGTDGVASDALAHDSRGSQGSGKVQTDSAECHQRSSPSTKRGPEREQPTRLTTRESSTSWSNQRTSIGRSRSRRPPSELPPRNCLERRSNRIQQFDQLMTATGFRNLDDALAGGERVLVEEAAQTVLGG